MTILIKDSTNVQFEKQEYDTILLDPPYMSNIEFQKFIGKKKKNKVQEMHELFLKTEKIEEIEERIFAYTLKNPCWIIYFSNQRWRVKGKYVINWMRETGGMGGYIRRNTEYISFFNNFKLKPAGAIDETVFILANKIRRVCSKPIKLYETIYNFLGSRKILDLFAGWGNSVIASQNLGLKIDAYDIDISLAERYNYLNSLSTKKQLTLEGIT